MEYNTLKPIYIEGLYITETAKNVDINWFEFNTIIVDK